MGKILFSALINDFEVYPKARITGPGKWSKRAKRCRQNQIDLGTLFKAHYKGEPISKPCILSVIIHLPHKRRCDLDNLIKKVNDALEMGGIIVNDYLIRGIDKARLWQEAKGSSSVEVILKEL